MSHELLDVLFDAMLCSTGVVALVLLARGPTRRIFGSEAAYGLWAAVPLALISLGLPTPSIGLGPLTFGHPATVALTITSRIAPAASSTLDPHAGTLLLAAWLTGVVGSAIVFARRQASFVTGLGQLTRRNGLFYARSSAGCPAVIGLLRPHVVVSDDFETRYTLEEQALILAHERLHIRRGDLVANALCALLRCVFWFNPLIHVAAGSFRFDQEAACDEVVIRHRPQSRRLYAGAVVKTCLADSEPPVGCLWPPNHPVKERLMLLRERSLGPVRRGIARCIVVSVVLATTYAAWATQPTDSGATSEGLASQLPHDAQHVWLEAEGLSPGAPGSGSISTKHLLLRLSGEALSGAGALETTADTSDNDFPRGPMILSGHVKISLSGFGTIQTDRAIIKRPRTYAILEANSASFTTQPSVANTRVDAGSMGAPDSKRQ